jgi:hypothetical protein
VAEAQALGSLELLSTTDNGRREKGFHASRGIVPNFLSRMGNYPHCSTKECLIFVNRTQNTFRPRILPWGLHPPEITG